MPDAPRFSDGVKLLALVEDATMELWDVAVAAQVLAAMYYVDGECYKMRRARWLERDALDRLEQCAGYRQALLDLCSGTGAGDVGEA